MRGRLDVNDAVAGDLVVGDALDGNDGAIGAIEHVDHLPQRRRSASITSSPRMTANGSPATSASVTSTA